MIKKIVSGGQTGADQAALDAAIAHSMNYGGWLPVGRRTERGPLPARYRMQVMNSGGYPERTKKNVLDSDATLIISHGSLTGGSALTAKIAKRLGKPLFHADLKRFGQGEAVIAVTKWLKEHMVEVLNIAGPRASSDKKIYDSAVNLIDELLKRNE